MSFHTATIITDFGDAALLLPLAAFILFLLWASRSFRAARAWLVAVGVCGLAMIMLKLGFRACGAALGGGSIASPSGHTALSATVYGCLAIIWVAQLRTARARILVALLGLAGILAIAVSRFLVQAHSISEILIGLAVGLGCTLLFRVLGGTRDRVPLLPVLFAVLIAVNLLHGQRANAETMLIQIAQEIRRDMGPICGGPTPDGYRSGPASEMR